MEVQADFTNATGIFDETESANRHGHMWMSLGAHIFHPVYTCKHTTIYTHLLPSAGFRHVCVCVCVCVCVFI